MSSSVLHLYIQYTGYMHEITKPWIYVGCVNAGAWVSWVYDIATGKIESETNLVFS